MCGKFGNTDSEALVARRETKVQLGNEMAREYQSAYVPLAVLSTICELMVKSDPVRSRLQRGTRYIQSQDKLVMNMFGLLCCFSS